MHDDTTPHTHEHGPARASHDDDTRPTRGHTLWLDCFAGMSGDMLLGALLDVGAPREALDAVVRALEIEGVRVDVDDVRRAGMRARFARVVAPDEHVHRHLPDVLALVDRALKDETPRARARAIFTKLAEAEARVHGIPVDHVHFHEVGAVDAIVDVAGACALLHALDVGRIVASPVRTGTGSVAAAHGEMPVPTPATALLLKGCPSFGGDVRGEACTPTGAALLASLVDAWGAQPMGALVALGVGAGTRDPAAHANVVRAFLVDERATGTERTWIDERLAEIECHIDDMSGEALGFLSEELLRGPAKDVVFTPVTGKKGRPAVLVRALVSPADVDAALTVLFTHASTLGARVMESRRVRLPREDIVLETPLGPVRAKRWTFCGRVRVSPEHDDLALLARARGLTLDEVHTIAERTAAAAGFADDEIGR